MQRQGFFAPVGDGDEEEEEQRPDEEDGGHTEFDGDEAAEKGAEHGADRAPGDGKPENDAFFFGGGDLGQPIVGDRLQASGAEDHEEAERQKHQDGWRDRASQELDAFHVEQGGRQHGDQAHDAGRSDGGGLGDAGWGESVEQASDQQSGEHGAEAGDAGYAASPARRSGDADAAVDRKSVV